MKKIIFYFIFSSLLLCMGVQTMYVPQSASLLANSSTGIAQHYSVNPANVYKTGQFFSFSKNDWFVDTKGQKISYLFKTKNNHKSYFSVETLINDKIPIYGTVANDSPLGYFDTYWHSVEYSQAYHLDKLFDLKTNILIGYKIKLNLSKLYAKNIINYSFDVGFNKLFSENFSLGFVVNNLSSNFSSSTNNLYSDNPFPGIGLNYKIPKAYLDFSIDLLYRNNYYIKKVSLNTLFSYANVILGLSEADNYSDFSYGISFTFKDWKIIYASLIHEDSSLGTPTSIEISKYF